MTAPQSKANGLLHMGDLQLDLEQRRLLRDGVDLKLSRLNFKLMHTLASVAPALVTKDDLADTVWDGRVVSPETVAQRIKLLRKALHDDANDPRYIEVVRGQGYRWIPEVTSVTKPVHNRPTFLGNPKAADGMALDRPAQPSVVVLPFDTFGDDNLEHTIFADGLTHDLITLLGRVRWLFVTGRGSAFMFRGTGHSVREIAIRLGVRYVVQGSVMFAGSRIRVNAAIADADSGEEIWADILQGGARDVFAIQDEIAAQIVAATEVEIELAEQKRAALRHPDSLDAWAAYHRGWWHLNAFEADSLELGEKFFRQAMTLDPGSSRAHAGLSCVHWIAAFLEVYGERNRNIDLALEHGQKAVSLDRKDPLAHCSLGRALHLAKEFDRSVNALEVATELNPNFAFGKFAHAFSMMHLGESERSNGIIESARRLSPYDPMSYAMLGVQAINNALLGDHDQAADISIRGAALQAWRCQMFPVIAAVCNVLADRDDVARDHYRKLLDERPGYGTDDWFRAFPLQRDKDVEMINGAFESLRKLH